MNAEDGSSLIWGVVMLVLLVSSLAARRLPLKDTAKMALAWIAIFAGLFVLFSFRGEFGMIWDRVKSEFAGTANQKLVGNELRLTRGDDGHYSVRTTVNGKSVNFLVDTGASVTSMSVKSARNAGVEFDTSSIPVILSTANGNAKAWRGRINKFDVGGIKVDDHFVLVGEGLGDTNLLGMNFMEQLQSYKVQGRQMILKP